MRSRWSRSIITMSAARPIPCACRWKTSTPKLLDPGGEQRRGADDPHAGAERLEQDDVGAGDAAECRTSPQIATLKPGDGAPCCGGW